MVPAMDHRQSMKLRTEAVLAAHLHARHPMALPTYKKAGFVQFKEQAIRREL